MMPIRVLIVEDSPLMRHFLVEAIGAAVGFEVVATAHSAAEAWDLANSEHPDVITLDVELPDMSGIAVLERLMQTKAPSVVMVSGLTQSGARTTLRALQLGAVDFIGKPTGGQAVGKQWAVELIEKLRRAAAVRPLLLQPRAPTKPNEPERTVQRSGERYRDRVVVIGAGSAATDTLNRLVAQLPSDCPPVVVAQQLSLDLIQALLPMLERRATVRVGLVEREEILCPGRVYVGAGDRHVVVAKGTADRTYVRPQTGEPLRNHRPSIDLLFESAAKSFGPETTGILLDAAGEDGDSGLRALKQVNARALRQARDLRSVIARGGQAQGSRERPVDIPEYSTERIVDLLFGAATIH